MNQKIRMAVVGVGGFGIAHARGIVKTEGMELAMVCDINEEYAKACAKEHDVPYCLDFYEMIKDETIDGVTIATPDFMHRDMVVAALRAGKHVLCEKPLALNVEECKEMISEAKKTDRVFMVGQICRYTPSFKKTKELIESGEIGELFFIESEYAHDYSYMPDDSWRKREDRHILVGGGCHAVDLIRWLAGNPTEVFGYGNHKMLPDWPTDDCTIGVMKFEDGTVGKVFCSSGCKRRGTMRTVIYGTKGTIICDNGSNFITLYRNEMDGGEKALGADAHVLGIQIPVGVSSHNIEEEIKDFAACINGSGTKVTAVEGASTVSVCTSIIKSCRTGLPEKVYYNFEV